MLLLFKENPALEYKVAETKDRWLLQFPEHTLPMIRLRSSRKYFPQENKPGVMMTFV